MKNSVLSCSWSSGTFRNTAWDATRSSFCLYSFRRAFSRLVVGLFIWKRDLFYQAISKVQNGCAARSCRRKQHHSALPPRVGSAATPTQRCHKSHVFSRALTTWPWVTSKKDWTGSYLHGNGDAMVCQGTLKRFTAMPQCGMLTFTPPTLFDSIWIIPPQRPTPNKPIWLHSYAQNVYL